MGILGSALLEGLRVRSETFGAVGEVETTANLLGSIRESP